MALGEPEIDADVAPIDLPERGQGIPKNRWEWLDIICRVNAQDADKRQVCRILRICRYSDAQREDPSRRSQCAAQEEHQLATVHSITSAFWLSSACGESAPVSRFDPSAG